MATGKQNTQNTQKTQIQKKKTKEREKDNDLFVHTLYS